jgi:GMP synthase (glutamine-hydrolysing)
MKPILVIEQEYSLRGLGLLGERLDASGLAYRSLCAWEEPIDDLEAQDYAAIVPMGGTAHVWQADRVPVLRSERVLLSEAVEAGVPVFGICLGGQLLASALGGVVRAAEEPEIGWLEIVPTDGAREDPIFRVLERGAGVYQWHNDVLEPPVGASVLATSEAVANQAFRVDGAEAWGIQFHPEVTPELFELWIARNPTEVKDAGVDVEALRTAVYVGARESADFCTALFDAFIDRVRSLWDASGSSDE